MTPSNLNVPGNARAKVEEGGMGSVGQALLQEEDLIDETDIDTLVREAIAQVIGENQFIHTKAGQWSANIVEGCLKRLAALAKPFK